MIHLLKLVGSIGLFAHCTIISAKEISFGSKNISLQESKSSVLQKLSSSYKIVPIHGTDGIIVWGIEDTLGSIQFSGDKVTEITLHWGRSRGSTPSTHLTRLITGALEHASDRSGKIALVTTERKSVPGFTYSAIRFSFSDREISINTYEPHNQEPSIEVSERIFQPQAADTRKQRQN